MFDVVSCPKCSGRVTLPEGAPQHGWVRCPICRAEYQAHHLLNYHPPELELIDEPAHPFEGRGPNWDAVAAAGAAVGIAPTAAEIAAPNADSIALETLDELAIAPAVAVGPISSAEVSDDSDVFTFDDSLLLDEPTGKLPYVHFSKTIEGETQPAGVAVSDVSFLADDSSEIAGAERPQHVGEIDVRDDDMREPPPLAGAIDAGQGDEIRATETHWSAKTVQDRGGPAAVTSMPQIGLAPRRRSRRRNPVLMILGIVGGGFLGLVIGYAILMFAFDPPKDPLRLAPRLPGFMVPAALRAGGEERVARFPADDQAGDGDAVPRDSTGDDAAKSSQQDNQSLVPTQPFGDPAADPARSNSEPTPDPSIDPLNPKSTQTDRAPSTTEGKDPLTDLFGDSSANKNSPAAAEPVTNPFDTAATDVKTDSQPSPTSAADAAKKLPADPVESLGPVSEKSYSYQDVLSAVAAAKLTTQRALDLPPGAPAAEKKKVNGPYYTNLCKIAEAITFIQRSAESELDDKATTTAIEAILNALPDQRRLEELGKLAGYWFDRPQGNGIVLTGMVKQSNPQGKLVESIVEPLGTSPPRPITIVSPSALTDDPGRPVLVAGTIVKDAGKNLRGYEGTAETVVWAAMAIDPNERNE